MGTIWFSRRPERKDGHHREAFRLLLATKADKEGLLERRYMELSVLVRNYDFNKGKYMTD